MNRAQTVCDRYLVIRPDGVLQIQKHCEPWPAGKPLWSSTAVFDFDAPPVPIHAGDQLFVSIDRAHVKSSGGHHPTVRFSSPQIVSVYGEYPGLPPHRGYRMIYGVEVETAFDRAGLGS